MDGEIIINKYFIIKNISSSAGIDRLAGRLTDSEGGKTFILNRIKDKKLINIYLPIYQNKDDIKITRDFKECFVDRGFLYVVFNYYDFVSLKEFFIDNQNTPYENYELAVAVVKKLIVEDIPTYAVESFISDESICIDKDKNIHINCFLSLDAKITGRSQKEHIYRVGLLLKGIFASELGKRTFDILDELIDNCLSCKYSSIIEILKALKETEHLFKPKDINNGIDGGINSAVEKSKRKVTSSGWFKALSAALVILIIAGFYIYLWSIPVESSKKDIPVFSELGGKNILNSKSTPLPKETLPPQDEIREAVILPAVPENDILYFAKIEGPERMIQEIYAPWDYQIPIWTDEEKTPPDDKEGGETEGTGDKISPVYDDENGEGGQGASSDDGEGGEWTESGNGEKEKPDNPEETETGIEQNDAPDDVYIDDIPEKFWYKEE